jgi:hypothetical protein
VDPNGEEFLEFNVGEELPMALPFHAHSSADCVYKRRPKTFGGALSETIVSCKMLTLFWSTTRALDLHGMSKR